MFLEESQGITRLILGIGRHLARHRQVVEKRQNLSDTTFAWVRMVAKGYKPLHPVLIRLFRADRGASAPKLGDERLAPHRLCVATRNRVPPCVCAGADRLQRTLVPRSRFRRRLTASVR